MFPEAVPPWIWPRAAYVHIPFCAHHCGYCDFAVAVGRDDHIDAYLTALESEMARLGQPQPIDTLFFGGGTPSYLNLDQLSRLLRRVLHWLPLRPGHEFSIEANPESLSADKVHLLADHGVNRISLGAQSFVPALLRVLEREHEPAEVPRAVERVRRRIDNVALDLIFGVPGQTLAQWRDDLGRALALAPAGIATYGLTFEKGTRLWQQQQRGAVTAQNEEAERGFYEEAMAALPAAGLHQYEISNFARPGQACRHNQVYWANHAYFGFGMGAASYIQGVRRTNTRDLATYVRKVQSGNPTHFQEECLTPLERALETAAVQLRRDQGILRQSFLDQTGLNLDNLVGPSLRNLVALGLVDDDDQGVRLTWNGKCLADAVICEMMKAGT